MKDNLIYMAYSVYHYAVMLPTRVYRCSPNPFKLAHFTMFTYS